MDYHSLNRKELQALCKKHNIPANSANSVMADKLSALFNEKQNPITKQQTCMKSTLETTEDGEPASSKRQKKKVRFSPSNDLVEYALRSGEKQKVMVTQIKTRRKSVANKVEKPVDNNTTLELVDDSAQVPVKFTRSRVKSSGKDVIDPINEKKQSRRVAKVKKETDTEKEIVSNVNKVTMSKAHALKIDGDVQHEENRRSKRLNKDAEKTSESVGETVVSRSRVIRSKAQNLIDGGMDPDVNPRIKKKSGKQVQTDGQNVEPSKGIINVSTRATRSRRQTLNEVVGNAVTDPAVVKKRTRKEMKATDLSSNLRDDDTVDKKEPPKRKSLRTRGVATLDEDGDKDEVVKVGRVTRSSASLEMEASGRNTKNKVNKVEVQQLEEPSKHASKKDVNRRKSVLQPEKTEAVLHLEEPVVMQKATPVVESPRVGKKQSKGQSGNLSVIESLEDKENVTRSGKDASENEFSKSRKQRVTPIIEDQIIETEDKSPKSSIRSARKIEEKSVVKKQVESSLKKSVSGMNKKSSVENASKGTRKTIRSGAITRDSSSKKRAKLSGTKQSDSEDQDVNYSKSGTLVANKGNFRESSSKKTAKASGSKILECDTEDVGTISSKEGTPVANMGKFKVDEELTEAEVTPSVGISDRRSTRSMIRSERQGPGQSAIEEQSIADTRLTSPKVAKFRADPAINTAPRRITRRGIIHGENAAGSFSEKVGKMKQTSQSALKKQSLDDGQMVVNYSKSGTPVANKGNFRDSSSKKTAKASRSKILECDTEDVGTISSKEGTPAAYMGKIKVDEAQMSEFEAAEVRPITDVKIFSPDVAEVLENPDGDTTGAGSESLKEATVQMSGDVSASIDMKCASPVSGEDASGKAMEDAGATPLVKFSPIRMTSDSMIDVVETIPDEVSDGSHVQNRNEEAYVESGVFIEAVHLETSILESERPDVNGKETDLTESGSTLNGLQTEVMIEEPLVSVGTAVVLEESVNISSVGISSKGNNGEDDNNADSISGENASAEYIECDVSASIDIECASPVPDVNEKETDLKESAPTLKGLQTEVIIEEPLVSVGKAVVMEETVSISSEGISTKGNNDDDDNNFDYIFGENAYGENASGEDIECDVSASMDIECANPVSDVNKKETDLIESGSTLKLLQTGVIIEEPLVSVGKVNVMEECVNISSVGISTKGNNGGDDNNCDFISYDAGFSAVRYASIQQSDVADDGGQNDEGESASAQKCLMPDSVSEDRDVADGVLAQEMDSVAGDSDDESNRDDTRDQLMVDDKLNGNDTEVDIVTARDCLSDHSEPTTDVNVIYGLAIDRSDVADDTGIQLAKEPEQMLNVAADEVLCDTVGQSNLSMSKDTLKTFATSGNDDMAVRADALEESILDINRDLVSSILGDTFDMDAEDDHVNEQRLTESDDGSQPKESPVGDTDSDLPTIKEDDRNKQGTSVDWGEYNFGIDEFEKPISTDVIDKRKTDDKFLDLQTSARTSSIEESSCLVSGFSNSVRSLEKGSRNVADGKSNEETAADSSLKSSFTTASSRTNHVNDHKADVVNIMFPPDSSKENVGARESAAHEFNHKWPDDHSKVFDGEKQDYAVRGSENELYEVQSFGHDPLNLFGDEEVGGSIDRSGRITPFEIKGDQVEQIKQFEFLSEAAGTSHFDPSGFKDKSAHNGEAENEKETLIKSSETDDHVAFDTRHL